MNRMNKARFIFAFIIVLLMITAMPVVAFATDVSVAADRAEVKAGDTVTVTVIVTADHIGVASGGFTYDPALLTYVSSDGGASDGYINMVSAQKGGSSSLSAVIKFTAKAKGTAVVSVTIDNILSYDEQALETGEGGVSITIAAADAPPQTSSVASAPAVDLSQTGVAAQNVTGAKAQMYVWCDLSSLTLPSGFADRQITYAGRQVGAADSDDMTLLYLSEAAGENAGYYIYNEQKNTLDPYVTITSKAASFTIIWPDQTVTAPAGFEETTLEWDDKPLPAWKAPASGDIVYLVYARNSKGGTGFYLINTEDESVQRYAGVPGQGAAPPELAAASTAKPVAGQTADIEDHAGVTIDRALFIVLCMAAALILAAAAVFATLYMRRERSNIKRVNRMKKRMEAEAKQKQPSASTPEQQAKEQEAPAGSATPPPPETTDKQQNTEARTKEKQAPASTPEQQVKEQEAPAGPATTPLPETDKQETAQAETKEKPAPLVKDVDLSHYPKGKDT